VGEMAFERYRPPRLIGQGGVGKVIGAAAAAIVLASFSVLASTPGVAQAVTPVQTPPEPTTRPWWPSALHFGLLVIAVCFVAWLIHRSRTWSTPVTASALWPARRGFGGGGIEGVLRARKRMALAEAGHRCAIPTCRHPTTEIAHIVPESQSHDDSFKNLIALCPKCRGKEIDARTMSTYKHNLEILNSRYSDFERRMFDQIAETDQRSFIVDAGLEIALLRAVNDGILRRVELAHAGVQRGEPTQYTYEVTDQGLDFIRRYVCGEDIA
jgi:5-methylcytosine-specific restriction endonuclease McrA